MYRFFLSVLNNFAGRISCVLMFVSVAGSFAVALSAGSYTWKGENNGLWNTASNWNEGLVPISISPSIILFNSSSTANPSNMNNDISGLSDLGFIITDPAADININAGNGFSLGSSGIDMSGASKNFSSNLPIVLGAAQTWNVASGKMLAFSGIITFANNLAINSGSNSGTIYLSGANDSSGTITVSGGTLKLGSATALGSVTGKTTVNNGTSATLDLNGIDYSTAEPLDLGGAGLSSNGALINSSSTAASYAGPITFNSDVTIGATTGDITLSGTISGGYNLVKTGPKTLTFTGNGNSFGGLNKSVYVNEGKLVVNKNSLNTVTGQYTTFVVGDGTGSDTLQNSGSNDISDLCPIIINNGGIFINNVNEEVGPVSSVSTGSKIVLNALLTIHTRGINSQFDGVISGVRYLQLYDKDGSLNLTNANTYSGGTGIFTQGCILYATNTTGSATGTSPVTAQRGAVLSGDGIISGLVTISDASIRPGYQGPGKLTLGSGLKLGNNSVLEFEAGTLSDTIAITGDLTLDGVLMVSALSGFDAGTYTIMTYTGTLTNNLLTVASMPSGFYGNIDLTTPNKIKLVVINVTAPIISTNATQFSNVIVKDSLIPTDTFSIWNSGISTMNYSITAKHASTWLSVSPSTGSCTTERDTIICHFGSSFPAAQRSSRGFDLVFKDSVYLDHYDDDGNFLYTDPNKTARFDSLWYDIFLDTLIVSSSGSLNNSIEIPVRVNYYDNMPEVGVGHSFKMQLSSVINEASISVYTLTGRKIKTAVINNGAYRQIVKSITNGLAPGVYLIVEKSIVSGITKQNVYKVSR